MLCLNGRLMEKRGGEGGKIKGSPVSYNTTPRNQKRLKKKRAVMT